MGIFDRFKKKQEQTVRVIFFFRNYVSTCKRDDTYKRNYLNICRYIEEYEKYIRKEIMSDMYDFQMAESFLDFLQNKRLMKNTINSVMAKANTMFYRMEKMGYKINHSFEDCKSSKEETTSTYLTIQEINNIYALTIKDKAIKIIRDVFVIGCLTGMRYSDYSNLNAQNIVGNVIQRKTKKTGNIVDIPIHKIVREILANYNGNFPQYTSSQANFNKVIKNIAKRAGVTGNVLWEHTVGKKVIRKSIPRWKMVCTHTARRSFATNLYLAGISPMRIMLMTGHKSETAFFGYIKIQKKENAEILSEHPFFK